MIYELGVIDLCHRSDAFVNEILSVFARIRVQKILL